MVKRVHTPAMVAHLWANQSQPDARVQRGNFYFTGDTIYSYGSHFPIARHYKGVVLLTTRTYSSTTAGHIADVRHAIPPGVTVFNVERPTELNHKTNLKAYQQRITDAAVKAKRAHNRAECYIASLQRAVTEANAYAAFFKLRTRFAIPADTDVDALIVKSREAKRKVSADKRRRVVLAKLDYADKVAKWLQGESVQLPYRHDAPTLLRVRGSRIETSEGAIVPVADAIALLPMIRTGAIPAGTRIGDFDVNRLDADGTLVVGCHRIPGDEIQRIAKELGL